mmetsp:Transcript_4227/g.11914  ORF Transcript_4227/g.11914 Transcript_4227/m.11914 type:complete len:138 (-) Transcript_4227:111-524(-)
MRLPAVGLLALCAAGASAGFIRGKPCGNQDVSELCECPPGSHPIFHRETCLRAATELLGADSSSCRGSWGETLAYRDRAGAPAGCFSIAGMGVACGLLMLNNATSLGAPCTDYMACNQLCEETFASAAFLGAAPARA